MAKSGGAEAGRSPPARAAAAELKREVRRLVRAITDDGDDGRIEAYDEATRALQALKDLKFGGANGSSGGKKASPASREQKEAKKGCRIEPVAVPDHFVCPISSEIMRDPVVVASGQTYDRAFIQEWLNSGNRTCPQTQQVLANTVLIPNHLVRSMILQWCTEQGITLPQLTGPDEAPITANERSTLNSLLAGLSSSTPEKKKAVKDLRLLTKRNRSFRVLIEERPDAISQLISVISLPGLDGDRELLEDTVTTILNLAIHDGNKKIIGDDPRAVPMLIDALKTGTMETRSNAAAALFTLSALDSNKIKIGELGAMGPLVELLERGTPAAKKDAGSAIFNLSMANVNRARAVRVGAVDVVLGTITDRSLVDESLAILALLSNDQEAVEEIGDRGGVACLLQILRESSCARNKENAVVVLFSVCVSDRRKLREVGEEETLNGTISDLANTGSSRARRKAAGILEKLRRSVHNTHYSC